ncbi:hypothetical protein CTI12_AA354350 [Artemisia annua]|uniref:RRM domain-containing protein n=1 Tax=Artemisia annua TaxID=35608 RepID=A0A2U1MQP7_ARTAN|nr:hypothetical protein CTI12_AA354350 [Artemisia annua]
MGESDWQELTRKNRRSVFERLKPSQTHNSNAMNDRYRSNTSTGIPNLSSVEKISTSIYVTNLSWKATTKEVWDECQKWGTVVDVFISSKTSMVGSRFGFVRFIRVRDVVNLISNLRSVWMGSFHLYADVVRNERVQFKITRQPIPTRANKNSSDSQEKRPGDKSFAAAVQQGSHDTCSRRQAYVPKKNDNYVEKHATCNNSISSCLVKRTVELNDDEGIRVKVNGKYYDVLINEFAYCVPAFEVEGDSESYESSESDCSDGQKSDTSLDPKVFEERSIEKPVPKSALEQSESDLFNLMGLIEKQGTNSVKKDTATVNYYDMNKVMEQLNSTENKTTEFNKDQANQCQEGSSDEQRIENNNNMENEKMHTNITEIKDAVSNNTVNDGMETTKSSWPPGYTEYASNIKRNKKAQEGTKCSSTRGSMESICSKRFKFSESDFVRVLELGNIIGLEMPSSFNEVNRLLHRMSEINVNR